MTGQHKSIHRTLTIQVSQNAHYRWVLKSDKQNILAYGPWKNTFRLALNSGMTFQYRILKEHAAWAPGLQGYECPEEFAEPAEVIE